jgi:hypothetical protein
MKTIMMLSLAGLVACGGGEEAATQASASGPTTTPSDAADAVGKAAADAVDALEDLDMGDIGDALEGLGKEIEAAAKEMGKELDKALEGLDLEGL